MPKATDFLRLARPTQWSKGVFVLIGPVYGFRTLAANKAWADFAKEAILAFVVFGLASSACYVVNDILDADADRSHPRKRRRPIASGAVSHGAGKLFAALLFAAAAVPFLGLSPDARLWVCVFVGFYVLNVLAYSFWFKHVVVLDVMSLSLGFVLRVLGGCAAVAIAPSAWLLNVTFFLAMFLAFGKRLGERRTLGTPDQAAAARAVHGVYTDEMLRMVVVVTGVISLVTYAEYVQTQSQLPNLGYQLSVAHGSINLLWLTILPATYGLLRCIVLLEHGRYDDPTELAVHDRPFQLAAFLFGTINLALLWSASGRSL